MGVPKFFRYISERYPCLSETLREYQIPEFDNLYLDMNGIIHGCSHPNDGDVQFRITEEEIFKNVFHYIEILFRMIQPQKLFFMAVDGVAPRAKINQQRGRRFRSAKEAEVLEAKARAKGIDIPTEKRFDSNCITPGTLFMAKLNKQLKYFISYKISTDRLWQKCTVIFSGSEVPGEGEHKIMDYIRYMKAQSDYNPNTRHCLYGLDADLIMLGLCTHEIHFCLLREVVKFGKKQTKIVTPEETKFCLLHLSLLREYIEHEFSPVKNKLSFPFDIEKIIDDWVLMGFLIGNDFIPNLPNLHIANGALPVLYRAYMEALPTLDGYINESGFLNLDRFEKFLEKLSYVDLEQFNEHYADLKYFESKTGRRPNEFERQIYKKIDGIDVVSSSPKKILNKDLEKLIYSTMEMSHLHSDDDDILDDESDSDMYSMEFAQHKLDYYMNKLEYENVDSDVLRSQAEGYVRAIQWNLHYYYHGCCSWSWYYPHHYAPYISDIKDFKDLKLEFDIGDPFLPFQQLLAVLPSYSKSLLPAAFQKLLTEEQSPIIDYYPLEFKTDLNGKRQEWEAVVLIPFIDEKNLLDAMEPHCSELTLEEQMRNKHGPMCLYEYTQENLGTYHAPEYFPSISNYAKLILINREDIFVPQEKLVKGLCPGVKKDVYFPGFPTLQYVKHVASLEAAKVKVFDQPSRGENMILHIVAEVADITYVASELLGKSVYVDWPHLLEARVVAVSNSQLKLTLKNPQQGYSKENLIEQELPGTLASQWILQKRNIIVTYKGRLGIDIGDTDILVSACPLIGMKYSYGSQGRLALEKEWTETPISYAYQTVVKDISVYSIHPMLYKTVDEIFSMKSVCFMLGHPHYGTMGQVITPGVNAQSGRIKVSMEVVSEPSLDMIRRAQMELNTQYMHGSIAAQRLGINSHLLSRITGTIYVAEGFESQQDLTKHNVGLNLKFNKRNEEVPGYTKKENGQWLYSAKAVDLIRRYMAKCPNLFERLAQNVTNNVFQEDELFTKGSGELADILSWLKDQQFHEVESRSCGTEVLDVDIVQQIEKGVSKFLKSQSYTKKYVLMQVKPHLLFKPGLHLRNSPPDPKSQNRLLDRVCCVRESFTVPLGYKGTIIGIQKAEKITETMFDVLFDESFPGGLAINGCSDCRGYRLSLTDFINISYGERIEYGRGGVLEMGSDTVESWKRSTNYKNQQSHVNTSAFASFNKENDHAQPGISRLSPQLRFIKKYVDETAQRVPCTLMHNPMNQKQQQYPHRNIHSDQNLIVTQESEVIQSSQKSTQMVGTSEFQALWNELHQSQKSSTTVHKLLPSPGCASINPSVAANKKAPQDPSAFLKAMLKISDESTNLNVPGKSTVSIPNNQSDAPPLVQQLFDHARQSVNKKEEKSPIWYCSQLLSHYQLTGVGMPRYSYFTDPQTKSVRAQILLPDTRIFLGKPCTTAQEAAESAAKKVYKELNLDKHQKPDAKLLLPPPQQWYNSRVNTCWTRNVRPPVIPMCPMKVPQVPQPSQSSMMFYPKWGQKSSQNPSVPNVTIHNSQNSLEQRQAQSDAKPKITATTPFVPLQAQKKSRNSNVNQIVRATRDTIKNLAPPVQQQKAVTSSKMSKQENLNIDPDKQSLANVPDTVQHSVKSAKPTRPRRSRLAAKFGSPPTVNGNESQ